MSRKPRGNRPPLTAFPPQNLPHSSPLHFSPTAAAMLHDRPSSPPAPSPIHSADASRAEIHAHACALRDDHLRNAALDAVARIRHNHHLQLQHALDERAALRTVPRRLRRRHRQSLMLIKVATRSSPTKLAKQRAFPNAYVTWVPNCDFLEFDMEEPYLPYFGDSKAQRKKADDLLFRMNHEYKTVTGKPHLSHESDDDTLDFHAPGSPAAIRRKPGSAERIDPLSAIRLRAAQRHAIYHTILLYGPSSFVLGTLSIALQIRNYKRVSLFYNIHRDREIDRNCYIDNIKRIRLFNHQIYRIIAPPSTTHGHPAHEQQHQQQQHFDQEDNIGDYDDVYGDVMADINTPSPPVTASERERLTNHVQYPHALKHFCRYCMVFACGIMHHDGANRPPRKPIPDRPRDERVLKLRNISKAQLTACSPNCFLLFHSQARPAPPPAAANKPRDFHRDGLPWNAAELQLLYDAGAVFEHDPCSLAVVLGHRSCKDVYEQLKLPWVRKRVDTVVAIARKPHIFQSPISAHDQSVERDGKIGPVISLNASDSEDSESDTSSSSIVQAPVVPSKTVGSSRRFTARKSLNLIKKSVFDSDVKRKKRIPPTHTISSSPPSPSVVRVRHTDTCMNNGAASMNGDDNSFFSSSPSKGTGDEEEEDDREAVCDHDGPCNEQSGCPCFARKVYCTTKCRCNQGRHYCAAGERMATVRDEECWQTAVFCECTGGSCDTNTCPCKQFKIACTPGGCKCDSCLLPSEVSVTRRRCKNCDVITGRHRRVHVGNSTINGMGLFAGQHFSAGDLVGRYYGHILNEKNHNLATMLGEEKKITYSFDLTTNMTIDATTVGSKTRFANHGKTPAKCNCRTDKICVLGKPHICIFATRDIAPGEELLFNYYLQCASGRGNNWIDKLK